MADTPKTAGTTPGARLRQQVARGCVIAPGAFSALVARSVAQHGFQACYISGGATANMAGVPDIGLLSLTEVCQTIRRVTEAAELSVIADADTGYGDVECARRTVVEYERAGAAALHVEDQVFPKRCGHLDDKELVPASEFAQKVAAMCAARRSKDFVIIARTDARGVTGMDDAVNRANLYREAGADGIFPEGLADAAEFAAFAKRSPGLLLANMTEFGKTAHISAADFARMGYGIVIYPLSVMRMAMKAVDEGLAALKLHGSMEPMLPRMQTRAELYALLGYKPSQPWPLPGAR